MSGAGAKPRFPVELRIALQWGEMDAMGHVNNTVYFRWFESARIVYFERMGWMTLLASRGNGPILHSTQARFRAALTFPDAVTVGARVAELAADRFTMRYEVRSERLGGAVACEGSGVIVAYDYRVLAKTPLPPEMVEKIRELEGGDVPETSPAGPLR